MNHPQDSITPEQENDSTNAEPTSETANRSRLVSETSPEETELVLSIHDASLISGEADVPFGTADGASIGEQLSARSEHEANTGKHAFMVGAGILLSRIVGLVRQRMMGHYFGTSGVADAFNAALRIPNFLQNVFGEGALSASFIPVYSGLLARKDEKEAGHVAGAVFSILALLSSIIVLVGVLATPYLITFLAPGFEEARRELTIRLVKIFFPGAGLLVLSAWCLGVLNSHRRFFLSYTAPVIWNIAIISSLVYFGPRVSLSKLAEYAAWGSVVGSALQFLVQVPTVLRLVKYLRPALDIASAHVRLVIRNFFPVFVSRGVVQISAYVDSLLASWLGEGAVAALGYTQSLYTLPVSLFGMAVSAAELPAMSSALGTSDEINEKLRSRLGSGLRRIAFFIVPSSMGFLALGDVMTAALYQTGKFDRTAVNYVWGIVAGSAVGLLASTLGRLYSSTYYALHDTRTPLVFAVVRVILTTVLGYLCSIPLPHLLGIETRWGAVGLTASAGVAGWVEFYLLRQALNKRIGRTGLAKSYVLKLWTSAAIAAGVGWGLKFVVGHLHPIPFAAVVLGGYGFTYFGVSYALGLPEAATLIGQFTRRLGFGKR